ncbi:MAG: 5-oxoprolinase subunit PxpB [Bryobacterales bacterium]|nr:5-oxoprolinase subunit PxpB [Bryobacterales bacterium]
MFRYASDQALYFDRPPRETDLAALARIDGVVNLHPAYESTLIVFDPLRTTHEAVERAARLAATAEQRPGRHHTIPVFYDGPDLLAVAEHHSMAGERVIELHASAEYSVAFLGFVPGFAYLTGLPAALHTPRRAEPRQVVPAGALGIAGAQTGIYPRTTPGGWQLIGRTPVELFDPAGDPMSLLQPGDRVTFFPA